MTRVQREKKKKTSRVGSRKTRKRFGTEARRPENPKRCVMIHFRSYWPGCPSGCLSGAPERTLGSGDVQEREEGSWIVGTGVVDADAHALVVGET